MRFPFAWMGAMLVLPAACLAQAVPLLQVSTPPNPGGGAFLVAHNTYSSPVEEYLIVEYSHSSTITTCAPRNRDAQGRCVMSISDRVQLPHGSPAVGGADPVAIAPDASRTIAGLTHPDEVFSVRDIAVIYANGAMAGEPSVLNQLLFERRRNLQDAEQDMRMLERIEAAPHPNWAKLEHRFEHRASMHDKQLSWSAAGGAAAAPLYGHSRDSICRQLARVFHNAANTHRPPGPMPFLESYLKWDIHELRGPPISSANGN